MHSSYGRVLQGAFLLLLSTIALFRSGDAQTKENKIAPGLLSNLESISKRVNEMANDFPEERFDYKPNPEVRSFAEVLLHIAGTNYYYVRTATSKTLGPEEPKRSGYESKLKIAEFVSASFKALEDQVKRQSEKDIMKNHALWIEAIMHVNEHYGGLVVYYRLNGIVPPTSRPK